MEKRIDKTFVIRGIKYEITYVASSDTLFLSEKINKDLSVFDELRIVFGSGVNTWMLRFNFNRLYVYSYEKGSVTEEKRRIKMIIKESVPSKEARKVLFHEVIKNYGKFLKLMNHQYK